MACTPDPGGDGAGDAGGGGFPGGELLPLVQGEEALHGGHQAAELLLAHLHRAPDGGEGVVVQVRGCDQVRLAGQDAGALGPPDGLAPADDHPGHAQVEQAPDEVARGQLRGGVDQHRDAPGAGVGADGADQVRPAQGVAGPPAEGLVEGGQHQQDRRGAVAEGVPEGLRRRSGPGLPHLHQLAPGGLTGLVHVVGAGGRPDHDLRAPVRGRLREGLDGGRVGPGQGGGGAEQDGPGGAGGDHRGRGPDLPRDLAPGGLLEGPQGDEAAGAVVHRLQDLGGHQGAALGGVVAGGVDEAPHAQALVHSAATGTAG